MKYFLLFAIIIALLGSSCRKKNDNQDNTEAIRLFNQSVEVYLKYTDLIQASTDSLTVDSLYNEFEKKITDINFEVPPLTDLKLSEQDNDSLFLLLEKLNAERVKKLKTLSQLRNDSIYSDSI